MYILYIVLAIVVLLFMVLVHEFGHYTIGRLLNFKITEFSVGFGKAIFSKTNKRGEKISLRIFPLGGYCAFAGEEEDNPDDKDSFSAQPAWKRILVFLAGVSFNFIVAVIFSLILLCTLGYDIPVVTKYAPLEQHVSGQEAVWNHKGQYLEEGDVIFAINGRKIDFAFGSTFNDIILTEQAKVKAWIKDNSDENGTLKEDADFSTFPTMEFTIRRNGQMQNIPVAFYQIDQKVTDKDGNDVLYEDGTLKTGKAYSLGIYAKAYVHSFWEALQRCVGFTFGLAWSVLKSLWMLITFQLGIDAIGGPITTITTIATVTQASPSYLLLLIPLISANLAVFNLLPLPALDGSHVLFTLIEWIRGKPINKRIENIIHTVGLAILFGLVILIDILHFLL